MQTFRSIEQEIGANTHRDNALQCSSPLTKWYKSLRDTPLSRFSPGDLAKAIRQKIYLEQIIPIAIKSLERDPLGGELYDGELLASLQSVPRNYWENNRALATIVVRICNGDILDVGTKTQNEIKQICRLLAGIV